MNKLKKLKEILKQMHSVLVAYSAGADSTFLLRVASDVLGKRVLAVTAISPTYPKEELNFSKNMVKILGVRQKIIKTFELKNKRFTSNPVNRCYFCKEELFKRLKRIAKENKINFVIDASNLSDEHDFRPGNKAKEKLKIRSPLVEAGFTKEDIRQTSKELGLVTWNKASLACLASRIPYGVRISRGLLERINKAETYLRKMGFKQVRLRHYNGFCRIEVFKDEIPTLINKRNLVVEKLKSLDYDYVTLDLEGYRTGSMNEVIKR